MNSKAQCFPVRPKPFDNEWFSGYVLRVADRNGRCNLNELCRTIGMPQRKTNYVIGHPQNSAFVKTCAVYLKRCPLELSGSFDGLTQQPLFDEHRLVRDISIASPKLCPHCIQENGYFKAEWQVAHITYCRKHSVMLLDGCPCCDTPFKWDSDLFEKCPKCAAMWGDLKLPLSPVPKYQYTKNEDVRESLRALYAALLFTFRPYDLMFDSLQTLQIDNETLHRHLLQAHALLTDHEFRSEWLLNYPTSTQFYPMHGDRPLNEYLKRLVEVYSEHTKNEQEHAIPVEKCEIQSVVRKPRLALASCPEDLNFQIGLIEATECLGLSGNELVELVEFGHITALNSPRIQRDILFDVRDLSVILQRLHARAEPISRAGGKQLVPLKAIFGKLKYFCMNQAQLINTLLSTQEIVLYSDQQTGQWQDIQVNETATLLLLDNNFTSLLPESLSSTVFRQMCGLSKPQLKTLITHTDLHYAGWHETDLIKEDVARKFFKNYFVLNRAVKLYGLHSTYHFLNELGFLPIFDPEVTKPVVLYDRHCITEALILTIFRPKSYSG